MSVLTLMRIRCLFSLLLLLVEHVYVCLYLCMCVLHRNYDNLNDQGVPSLETMGVKSPQILINLVYRSFDLWGRRAVFHKH